MSNSSRRHFFKTTGASLAGVSPSSPPARALPKLTLACADYVRFLPLATADVRPKDFELVWLRGPRAEMLRREVLVELFDECGTRFQDAQRMFPYATPWQIADVEQAELLLGREYHGHGLERNRRALDVFCEQAFKDGLTKRRVAVEEYFADFLGRS